MIAAKVVDNEKHVSRTWSFRILGNVGFSGKCGPNYFPGHFNGNSVYQYNRDMTIFGVGYDLGLVKSI